MSVNVVISGVAVLLPGADSVKTLLDGPAAHAAAVDAAALVGKKGLRYKDRATQLGYCLASSALRDAGLEIDGDLAVDGATIGVIVSSNYGNLDTIVRALDTIREEKVMATSAMDLPNASSNVIASSIAIRYGLRGPNLMVCNGATSGLDAVHWAITMIRAGRVDRVLVVGVEPDNPVVRRLLRGTTVVDGGAAVVIESEPAARQRGVPIRAELGAYSRTALTSELFDRLAAPGKSPSHVYTPEAVGTPLHAELLPGTVRMAFPEHTGRTSGALGVLQCAAAVGLFDGGERGRIFAVSGAETDDASAGLVLIAPEAA